MVRCYDDSGGRGATVIEWTEWRHNFLEQLDLYH
jgi:hypothetical protein